ncbi:c-type cytochrome [Flaviflagellibacter deserti]|uniref:C-type cytochrome n=1 Tax=Flaviflagellibacter deserti TaxID=2267266 RepID=A0ABV9YZV8_9HYPH
MPLPQSTPPSGQDLFKRQCAACHTATTSEPKRQGPTLFGVFGRKVGSVPDFKYSAGFSKADWAWDEQKLDAWLADPQAMIPGAIMPYRQAKPEVRTAIIQYLKDMH